MKLVHSCQEYERPNPSYSTSVLCKIYLKVEKFGLLSSKRSWWPFSFDVFTMVVSVKNTISVKKQKQHLWIATFCFLALTLNGQEKKKRVHVFVYVWYENIYRVGVKWGLM